MRILQRSEPAGFIEQTGPLKGGGTAASTAAGRLEEASLGGRRAIYVLARRRADTLETPVFAAGEDGQQEAVAVFTTHEAAHLYLQAAD